MVCEKQDGKTEMHRLDKADLASGWIVIALGTCGSGVTWEGTAGEDQGLCRRWRGKEITEEQVPSGFQQIFFYGWHGRPNAERSRKW